MNLMNLVDGPSAAIGLGGTLIATVLRSGIGACRTTLVQLAGLVGSLIDPAATTLVAALTYDQPPLAQGLRQASALPLPR